MPEPNYQLTTPLDLLENVIGVLGFGARLSSRPVQPPRRPGLPQAYSRSRPPLTVGHTPWPACGSRICVIVDKSFAVPETAEEFDGDAQAGEFRDREFFIEYSFEHGLPIRLVPRQALILG